MAAAAAAAAAAVDLEDHDGDQQAPPAVVEELAELAENQPPPPQPSLLDGVDVSYYEGVLFPVPLELKNQSEEIDELNGRLSTIYESISLVNGEVGVRNVANAEREIQGFDTHTNAIQKDIDILFRQVDNLTAVIVGLEGMPMPIPQDIAHLQPAAQNQELAAEAQLPQAEELAALPNQH